MFLTSLSSDKTFKKSVKNVNTNNTIKKSLIFILLRNH